MSTLINELIFSGTIENKLILTIIDGILTIIVVYFAARFLKYLVEKGLKKTHGNEKVINTLIKLLISAINVIFIVIALFTILDTLGINTASLVATAGIGGVAIGFGAQSLVKDIISGFFILLEGQYYVGDTVVIQEITGTVVDFNLRTTKLQDFNTGAIHIIPNGMVELVENRSRADQLANLSIDVPIDYEPETILAILRNKLENYEDERIITGPKVLGISDWKDRYYTIFIRTVVQNGEMYEIQRILRKMITEELKNNQIEMYRPMLNLEVEGK